MLVNAAEVPELPPPKNNQLLDPAKTESAGVKTAAPPSEVVVGVTPVKD